MAGERRRDRSNKHGFLFSAFPKDATPAFWAALVVGAAFICLPTIFRTYFAVNGTQSNLVICIGAGIILAAFGGQANFQMKGIVFVGAAGIAVGLFWYLQQVSHKLFLEGTLNFYDLDKYQSMSIENRHTVLGAAKVNQDNLKRSSYEFVIVKNQIVDDRIVVALVTREKNKREVSVFVDAGKIEWAFGETRRLQWELRERTIDGKVVPSIYDTYRKTFVSDERIAVRQSDVRFASMPSWALVREAVAQDAAAKVGVDVLLQRLKSDETPIRLGARKELSDVSVETLPTILKAYREEYSDYRV